MRALGAALAAAALAAVTLSAGCATGEGAPAPRELVLECERPMTVLEFLKYVQVRTGRIYLLRAEVDPDARIEWVGTLRCDEQQFEQFVQTMLYIKGLALQPRQDGELELLEVVSLTPR